MTDTTTDQVAACLAAWRTALAVRELLDPVEPIGADAQPGDGVSRIAAERKRQVTEEGWTAEHDAAHGVGVLARAGACYAWYAAMGYRLSPLTSWPWDERWWKPGDDPVRTLVKAGALIAAEIDRLLGEEASREG